MAPPVGRPGPAPKPSHLRALEGNRGHQAKDDEPAAPAKPKAKNPGSGAPPAPAWMSREAKAEWRRIVPKLAAAGMVSQVDRGLLSSWCSAWATFVAAQKLVDELGPVVQGARGDGDRVKNPAWQVARDAMTTMRALSSNLCLSYADRARVDASSAFGALFGTDDDEKGGGIAELLSG